MNNYLVIFSLLVFPAFLSAACDTDVVSVSSQSTLVLSCNPSQSSVDVYEDAFDSFHKMAHVVCPPLERLKLDRITRKRTRELLYSQLVYLFAIAYKSKNVVQLVALARRLNQFVEHYLLLGVDKKVNLMSAIICNDQRAIQLLTKNQVVLSYQELVTLELLLHDFSQFKKNCFDGIMYYNDCMGHSNT